MSTSPILFRWVREQKTCPVHGDLSTMHKAGDNVLQLSTPDGKTTHHCGECWADWYREQFPALE